MLNLKKKILIFFAIYLSLVSGARRWRQMEPCMRYTYFNCSSSLKTIPWFKCFIKAFSRENTTLNIQVNMTRPVYNSYVRYDISYRSLSNSRRSIINVTGNLCEILNGTRSHPVMHWIMGMMPMLKEYLHPCPYVVNTDQLLWFIYDIFKLTQIEID